MFNPAVGSGWPTPPSVTLSQKLEPGHKESLCTRELETSKHVNAFFVSFFLDRSVIRFFYLLAFIKKLLLLLMMCFLIKWVYLSPLLSSLILSFYFLEGLFCGSLSSFLSWVSIHSFLLYFLKKHFMIIFSPTNTSLAVFHRIF